MYFSVQRAIKYAQTKVFKLFWQTVTFQAVYATDGQRAYAFYSYQPYGMTFTEGQQFIGILAHGYARGLTDSSDGSYLRRPDKNLLFNCMLCIRCFCDNIKSNFRKIQKYSNCPS